MATDSPDVALVGRRRTMTGLDLDEVSLRNKLALTFIGDCQQAGIYPPADMHRHLHGDVRRLLDEVDRLRVAEYVQGDGECVEHECEHVVDDEGRDIPDLDHCPELERCVATADDAIRLNRIRQRLTDAEKYGDDPAELLADLLGLANDDLDD